MDRESEDSVDDVNDAVRGPDVRLNDVGCHSHAVQSQGLVVGLVVEPELRELKMGVRFNFKICHFLKFNYVVMLDNVQAHFTEAIY